MLNSIHRLKSTTYLQRQNYYKSLNQTPLPMPAIEAFEAPQPRLVVAKPQLSLPKPKYKLTEVSFESSAAPRCESLERTMTNLSQRPDSFDRIRAKLHKPQTPKRRFSVLQPRNIHTAAARNSVRNYFRSKAYAPFLATSKRKEEESFNEELSTSNIVKSITIERVSLGDSLSLHFTQ